ncbi:MAG: HgcAB-like fusion protein, partial [Gemmatimonadota bacterium]
MSAVAFASLSVVQTLLRVLPFPARKGLVRIGDPSRASPVLLTGNFRLTVQRVTRALRGVDAWLLVADSGGVNVWCAATGGLLTNHDVVSVLKTSGVADLVDHRRVVLPQLAATGIEGREVHRRIGWRVIWGPVEAADLPAFLRRGCEATPEMRAVRFPWPRRLEMAVAWAFPISLLALPLVPFWKAGVLPLVGLVWALSFLLFAAFPLTQGQARMGERRRHLGFVFFDFGPWALPLATWLVLAAGLALRASLDPGTPWSFALRWGLASLIVLLVLSLDLTGSTPVSKSGLHADRLLTIELDPERCRGAAFCEQVCPRDVLELDVRRRASLARPNRCVQCGACIVQCPFDALYFRGPDGAVVEPTMIREFKLNLLGRRRT